MATKLKSFKNKLLGFRYSPYSKIGKYNFEELSKYDTVKIQKEFKLLSALNFLKVPRETPLEETIFYKKLLDHFIKNNNFSLEILQEALIGINSNSYLHEWANSDNIDFFNYLYSKGLELNIANKRGEAPLDIAVKSAHEDMAINIVNLINSDSALITNYKNSNGDTILHTAAKYNCTKLLVNCLNLITNKIFENSDNGNAHQAIEQYITFIDAKNKEGKTAFDYANQQHNTISIQALETFGASSNSNDISINNNEEKAYPAYSLRDLDYSHNKLIKALASDLLQQAGMKLSMNTFNLVSYHNNYYDSLKLHNSVVSSGKFQIIKFASDDSKIDTSGDTYIFNDDI